LVERRDYYETLGVGRDADEKAIEDAFRPLALERHPECNQDPDASNRFREIAEAWAAPSDPGKRADHDARGHPGVTGLSLEDLPRPSGRNRLSGGS